jgi:hypothetical protein
VSGKAISGSHRLMGGRNEDDYLRISKKQRLINSRDERMNTKLTRHRVQALKRKMWWFGYAMSIPLAISMLGMAWKLAIWVVAQ